MKTNALTTVLMAILGAAGLASTGCDRKTRANPANEQYRAATPNEGGGTLTQGSAGDRKNFGDTRTKTEEDGKSQSSSPTGLSRDVKPGQPTQTSQPQTPTTTPPAAATPSTTK